MVDTPLHQRRVGGVTVKDLFMFLTPAAGYLVIGLLAWGDMRGEVRLLMQAQDVITRGLHQHAGQLHDPRPVVTQQKIQETQAKVHEMETRQAVIEQIVTDTQKDVAETKEDISENRAILESISRGVNDLRRDQ